MNDINEKDRYANDDTVVQVSYAGETDQVTLWIKLPTGMTVDSPPEQLEPTIMAVIEAIREDEWPEAILDAVVQPLS